MISLPSSTEGGGEFQGWSGPEFLPCRAISHVNDVVDAFGVWSFFMSRLERIDTTETWLVA
jgi:hypothetical protein